MLGSDVSSLPATATGTFERTPLSHLLVYCLDRGLTGTLVLQTPDDVRHAVYFLKGVPHKVRTGTQTALLGRLLVERGAVDTATVEDALVAAQTLQILVGQALVDAGALTPTVLIETLRVQMARKLTALFDLPPATAFGFYETNLLESWGGPELTPVDVLAVLMAGVRLHPDMARIDAALASLDNRSVKLHADGDFKRFQLDDRARGVVDLLRFKPMTLAALLKAGIGPEPVVRQVLYVFLLTRHLDLGGQSNKPPLGFCPPDNGITTEAGRAAVGRMKLRAMPRSGGIVEVNPPRNATAPIPSVLSELGLAPTVSIRSSTSNPPVSTPAAGPPSSQPSPEIEARRLEILQRYEAIEREDFFTMLGVPQDAPVDVVQSAYFALAKRWHPDRLPAALASVRDEAARVFARLSEASQTLTDLEKRARYMELLKQGGGTPEEQAKVTQMMEAQLEHQKAEILLKKGDLAGAERLAASATSKDPDQPDYMALLAWLRASRPDAAPDVLAASIAQLTSVLDSSPRHQKALWYRGSLLKRVGRENAAINDFKHLIELDARHVDAAREIRLFEMRSGGKDVDKGSPKAENRGLFGGLFKK